MARCNTKIHCTVVGFNFVYVTLALAIIGVLLYRRVSASPLAETFDMLVLTSSDDTDWNYPSDFYLLASVVPTGVSTVAMALAFLWTSVIRPSCCGHLRWIGCKESTSVLFVLLMVGYTALLFPGPLVGLSLSQKLDNVTFVAQLTEDMRRALISEEFYKGPALPENNTLTKFGKTMEYIQSEGHCCGIIGYKDYDVRPGFSANNGVPFPFSCCRREQNRTIDWELCREQLIMPIYGHGCINFIMDQAKTRFNILNGAGFSGITICIITALLSVILAIFNIWQQMKQERERKEAGYGGSKTRVNRDDHAA